MPVPRLTLREFVATNAGAALVFPDGPPETAAAPGWTDAFHASETDICEYEFFLRYTDRPADLPLDEVVYYCDCIGFMNVEECLPWVGIWMCAGLYSVDVLVDQYHMVTAYAQYALEECLEAGRLPVPLEAAHYYARHAGQGEDDEDYVAALAAYRAWRQES